MGRDELPTSFTIFWSDEVPASGCQTSLCWWWLLCSIASRPATAAAAACVEATEAEAERAASWPGAASAAALCSEQLRATWGCTGEQRAGAASVKVAARDKVAEDVCMAMP